MIVKQDIKKAFGRLLRDLREKRSLSQAQISNISGIDRAYISELERGQLNPSLSTIIKLSTALEISLVDFMRQIEVTRDVKKSQPGKNFSGRLGRELGAVISTMRKQCGLTISDFSVLSGLSSDRISKMEHGVTKIDVLTLYRVAKVLDVRPSEILKRVDKGLADI